MSEELADRCHPKGQDNLSFPSPVIEQQNEVLHKYPLLFLMPEIKTGIYLLFIAEPAALDFESQNHEKISPWKGLTRITASNLLVMPRTASRIPSCAWKHYPNSGSLGAASTSLERLFQCPVVLCLRKPSSIPSLNPPWHGLMLLPWALSLVREKRPVPVPPTSLLEEAGQTKWPRPLPVWFPF